MTRGNRARTETTADPVSRDRSTSGQRLTRRYTALVALRWFPTGLMAPIVTLLAVQRGLSLAEVGIAIAVQGVTVLLLELPSGALSDAMGRRFTLLTASVVGVAAAVVLVFADGFEAFLIAFALQGVWRALDSGTLEAWFVDNTVAAGTREPITTTEAGTPRPVDQSVATGLSAGALTLNLAMGCGALLSGGLVALGSVLAISPLLVPLLAAVVLTLASPVAVAALVRDAPRSPDSLGRSQRNGVVAALRTLPREMSAGLTTLRRNRILLALVSVELFWGFGMVAFETFFAPRLGEVVGSATQAGLIMGPVTSAGWLAGAVGALVVPRLGRRIGIAPVAAALRILQGATVVAMGLVAGPVGLIAAFVACYTIHGASNPAHNTLLHREASNANRAMVLSLNSMVAQPAYAIGAIVLGGIATGSSLGVALVVGGIVLACAAPLYLPSWRAERRARVPVARRRPGSDVRQLSRDSDQTG